MICFVLLPLRLLASRGVRAAILKAAPIVGRTIWNVLTSPQTIGIIGGALKGLLRFGGFLIKRIGLLNTLSLSLTFTIFWRDIISAINFLWNFNWNQTDATLDAAIKGAQKALAAKVGGAVGNALGYLVCGAIPGTVVLTFNEPLALHLFEELEEEAIDEITANMSLVLTSATQLLARSAFTYIFKNIRTIVRESDAAVFNRLYDAGITNKAELKKILEKRNRPWSFAIAFQEILEKKIPDEVLREAVEEMFEEFSEACIDAGYIIAGRLDSYVASARAAAGAIIGPEQTIEILFNRPVTATSPSPTPPTTTP